LSALGDLLVLNFLVFVDLDEGSRDLLPAMWRPAQRHTQAGLFALSCRLLATCRQPGLLRSCRQNRDRSEHGPMLQSFLGVKADRFHGFGQKR
jgi:hypothetical protein